MQRLTYSNSKPIRFSFVENFDAARYFTFDNVTGDLMIAAKGNIDRETIGSSLSYTIQAADMCKH